MKIDITKKELELFLEGLEHYQGSIEDMLHDNGHLLNDLAIEEYERDLKAIKKLVAKLNKGDK